MKSFAALTFALSSLAHAAEPSRLVEKFDFTIPNGQTLTAKVLKPAGETPAKKSPKDKAPPKRMNKLPAVMIFGGFQGADDVLDLIHTNMPVILTSFDYPFEPPRKFEFPRTLKYAPQVKTMIHDTIAGIRALCRILTRRDDVDPSRITIIGGSFGTPFAIIGGAENPEIKGIVIVHGFGDVPETAMHQLLNAWKNTPRWLSYPAAWLIAHLGWAYVGAPAPEVAARQFRPEQSVLMVSANHDSFIPAKSTEVLWDAIKSSNAQHDRIATDGEHLLPGSSALIERILKRVSEWMRRENLL